MVKRIKNNTEKVKAKLYDSLDTLKWACKGLIKHVPLTTFSIMIIIVLAVHPTEYIAKRDIIAGEIINTTNSISQLKPLARFSNKESIDKTQLGNILAIEPISKGQIVSHNKVEIPTTTVSIPGKDKEEINVGDIVTVTYVTLNFEEDKIERVNVARNKRVLGIIEATKGTYGEEDSEPEKLYTVDLTITEYELYKSLQNKELKGATIVSRQVL